MAYDLYDFTESVRIAGIQEHAIEKVYAAWGFSPEGFGSWNGGFLLLLKDGRSAYVHGWCDTTGWGCRDGAEVHYFDGLPDQEVVEKLSRQFMYLSEQDTIDWENPINCNLYLKGKIDRFGSEVV